VSASPKTGVSKSLTRIVLLVAASLVVLPGCPPQAPQGEVPVPEPLGLLLPKRMRIHPFSDVIPRRGGGRQVEVRIEAFDAFGDATKMFGEFRFELYALKPRSSDQRGRLIDTWDVSIMAGETNLVHWDGITRTYVFKLDWDKPLPGNPPFVMRAVFSSPFTERFIAERVFERE